MPDQINEVFLGYDGSGMIDIDDILMVKSQQIYE